MIGSLKGRVSHLNVEGHWCLVDIQGVGYLVQLTEPMFGRLAVGEAIELAVYTHVREDQLTLYGFASQETRMVFAKLLGVNGVGPKMALSILSTFEIAELRHIALSGNHAALKKIPGVGAKTAQRLGLELSHVVDKLPVGAGTMGLSLPVKTSAVKEDLNSALANLGYTPAQIKTVIEGLENDDLVDINESSLDELLRRSLQLVNRR